MIEWGQTGGDEAMSEESLKLGQQLASKEAMAEVKRLRFKLRGVKDPQAIDDAVALCLDSWAQEVTEKAKILVCSHDCVSRGFEKHVPNCAAEKLAVLEQKRQS